MKTVMLKLAPLKSSKIEDRYDDQHDAMMTMIVIMMMVYMMAGEESPSEDEGDSEWGDYTSLYRFSI